MKNAVYFRGFCLLVCFICPGSFAAAGDLNPPGPPTGGTMKPLDQVEPRTAVQTLSGNTNSTHVIAQSGSYYLTGNLAALLNKHAIEIAADHVTLDLCGFTITGSAVLIGQTRYGIYLSGRKNVEIRNGTIRNCRGYGIAEDSVDGRGHRVESIRVQDNYNRGIYLNGKGHWITQCTAIGNQGEGIWAGFPSFIEDNQIYNNLDNLLLVRPGRFFYLYLTEVTELNTQVFSIARYETTNAQYCEFLNGYDPYGEYWNADMEIDRAGSEGEYTYTVQSGMEHYPIRYVSFFNASAYAGWLSQVTGQIYRLPTSQEWQKAASYDAAERKKYVYGFNRDSIDSSWCNYNNAYGGPLPVGSFNGTGGKNDAPCFYGCYDMSGNVKEWTSTPYNDGDHTIIGGGDWTSAAGACEASAISYAFPAVENSGIGFRVVREIK